MPGASGMEPSAPSLSPAVLAGINKPHICPAQFSSFLGRGYGRSHPNGKSSGRPKNQQSHRIHMPERLLDTPKHRGGEQHPKTQKWRAAHRHSKGPDSLPSAMAHKAPLPMFLFIDRSQVTLVASWLRRKAEKADCS